MSGRKSTVCKPVADSGTIKPEQRGRGGARRVGGGVFTFFTTEGNNTGGGKK